VSGFAHSLADVWQREVEDTGRAPTLISLTAFLVACETIRMVTHAIRRGNAVFRNVSLGGTHIHHLVWDPAAPRFRLPRDRGRPPTCRSGSPPVLFGVGAALTLRVVVQQLVFQRGAALVAIGVMVAATNVRPIVAGLVIFDDPVPSRAVGLVLRVGGFALALVGLALLARVSEGEAVEPAAPAAPVGAAS
jgi:hypothetical protein